MLCLYKFVKSMFMVMVSNFMACKYEIELLDFDMKLGLSKDGKSLVHVMHYWTRTKIENDIKFLSSLCKVHFVCYSYEVSKPSMIWDTN